MMERLSKKQRFSKGFTLIELTTVAIVIIVLVSLTIVWMQPNKAKSRDTKRVAELNALRTALQMYYMDNGHYPINDSRWCSIEQIGVSDAPANCDNFRQEIEPYLSEIPGDPFFPKTEGSNFYSYQYRSTSSGEGYKLYTDLETRDSYELYSYVGKEIAYTPNGGSGGGGTCPSSFIKLIENGGGGFTSIPRVVQQTTDGGFVIGGDSANFGQAREAFIVKLNSGCGVEWAKTIGGPDEEHLYGLKQTSDYGFIAIGDTEIGVGYRSLLLVKFDSEGILDWVETIEVQASNYTSKGIDVEEVSDGYILLGYANSTPLIPLLLMKVDLDGNKVWAKMTGASSGSNYAYSLAVTSNNIVITGETSAMGQGAKGGGYPSDLLLVHFDNGGDFQWARALGVENHYEIGRSIEITPDENFYVVGGSRRIDGNQENDDSLLVKFDTSGDPQWTRTMGKEGEDYDDRAGNVSITPDGNFYILGGRTADPGTDSNLMLSKFSSDATFQWTKIIDGGSGYDSYGRAQALSDGIVIVGSTYDFGATSQDYVLARFDSDDNIVDCSYVEDISGLVTVEDPNSILDSDDSDFSSADFTNSFDVVDRSSEPNFVRDHTASMSIIDSCPE